MSIWASSLSFSDVDHLDGCAACDCGVPHAPLVYQGSHVLPCDDDRRGGEVGLSSVPDFIERDGRAQDHGRWDWLRLHVIESPDAPAATKQRGVAWAVLDRTQVEEMRDWLTGWLDREPLGEQWR